MLIPLLFQNMAPPTPPAPVFAFVQRGNWEALYIGPHWEIFTPQSGDRPIRVLNLHQMMKAAEKIGAKIIFRS